VPERTLYVVTHPEATHHVDRLVGGQYDSELTVRGRRQAASLAQRLVELIPRDIEVELFTSDLRREDDSFHDRAVASLNDTSHLSGA
jgi:2,3-bisphosphoglycerate-dependent phosphoglycerate mutase